jgi:pyruvate kinase
MRRQRHAKIVASLGWASSDAGTIRALFDAGADVFRFNFGHDSHEQHRPRYDIVRRIEQEVGRPIAIPVDLQGPKLRIGRFADGPVTLEAGGAFRLDFVDTRVIAGGMLSERKGVNVPEVPIEGKPITHEIDKAAGILVVDTGFGHRCPIDRYAQDERRIRCRRKDHCGAGPKTDSALRSRKDLIAQAIACVKSNKSAAG